MTNKPKLSVERELLERVADNRYRDKERISIARHEALWELRALLDKQSCGACNGCANGCTLDRESPQVEPAAPHQGEPVPCDHQWIDDGQFLLVCTACGAQDDYAQALQLAFELGGTDDGSYDLEAEEICEVIRRHAEQSAQVAEVPEGYCIMPRRLTAENGAKALLLGEFKLRVTKECPECCELEEPIEGCSMCDGEGEYEQRHTIPWDQIKFIYSQAVAGLARINKPL
jgi:hypothetical protein